MPTSTSSRKTLKGQVIWTKAPDVKKRTSKLIKALDLDWVKIKYVHFYSSKNSKARAYARIWGLSRIWQQALNTEPSYILEVISEKFERLSIPDQDKVLLHELAHIPKNFSGSLVPHYRRGKRKFNDRVKTLVTSYTKRLK